MIRGRFIVLAPLVLACSCFLFNVTSMKASDYATIKRGDGAGQISYKIDEFGLEDLTCKIFIHDDKICLVDNIQGRIQVVEPDGDIQLILGSLNGITGHEKVSRKFNFSTIGALFMDEDGNLFVQNIISQSAGSRYTERSGGEFSPSYVLVFNKSGMLQYALGQNGSTSTPFSQIDSIEVDSEGRLIVISRTFDAWNVYSFKGKNLNYHINLAKLDFNEKEGDNVYTGKIENVKMYSSGDKFLISADYYDGLRLKYRKVFVFSVKQNRIEKTLMTIPDPKNVLFTMVDDKLIYFWNIDRDVRFSVYNHEGNIVSNIKLDLNSRRNYYTRIIEDRKGDIYSYHINKEGIQVLEWE